MITFNSDSRKSFCLPVLTTEQENLSQDEDPLIQNLRQVGISASEDTSGRSQMISDHEDIVSGRKWFGKGEALEFAPEGDTVFWVGFVSSPMGIFQDDHSAG